MRFDEIYYTISIGNTKGIVQNTSNLVGFGIKNHNCLYLGVEEQLRAHILRIRSTIGYYNLVQYEPQTPTHVQAMQHSIFFLKMQVLQRNLLKPY